MGWSLSRFRAGDTVEVRSREEILASLDEHGRLGGMPFMPEMLQFCGRRMTVAAVAHKACDTAGGTWQNRRLDTTVHLVGARCDGSAHDGCQAACNLFWRDEWLRPVGDDADEDGSAEVPTAGGCAEEQLLAATRVPAEAGSEEERYACQATQMFEATQNIRRWDVRQYMYDVTTGNRSAGRAGRVLALAQLRWLRDRLPWARRAIEPVSETMHKRLSGRPSPSVHGRVPDGEKTPTGRLDLQPGEWVRIKSQEEIEETIDQAGKNRGLWFDHEEMAPYCGRVAQVRDSVTQIIHEPTGRMIRMKQPCIMLEGVVCKSAYAKGRLNCPRAIPSYWREIWLERVEAEPAR